MRALRLAALAAYRELMVHTGRSPRAADHLVQGWREMRRHPTFREVEAFLQLVREARLTKGTKVAAAIWARTPLPSLDTPRAAPVIDPAEAQACLDALIGIVVGQSEAALSALGLRNTEDGLFVGNQCSAFQGTRWAAGLHRLPLMALPGVRADTSVRSLAGQQMRGIVIPVDLLAMEGV